MRSWSNVEVILWEITTAHSKAGSGVAVLHAAAVMEPWEDTGTRHVRGRKYLVRFST